MELCEIPFCSGKCCITFILAVKTIVSEVQQMQQHPATTDILLTSSFLQARVVYDLAEALGWKTVQMLTTAGSPYSKSLREEFNKIVGKKGDEITVCETLE